MVCRRRPLLALLAIPLAAAGCGGPGPAPSETPAAPPAAEAAAATLLDGREKALVVVGYSTSYAWPAMLQDMLDQHSPDGERRYHVLNAVVGGSPVDRWLAEPGSEDYEKTFGAMLRDFFGPGARLRGDAPEPTVALCQQSLQRTRTDRGPVASADDAEGIRIGADALEALAFRLRDHGVAQVLYGMHIYKHPVEPEVGNERLALAALLDRGHGFVRGGPDLWTPTRDEYPGAFEADGVHPNARGMKIMAEGWYRAVAGDQARDEVVAAMHQRPYDIEAMMQAYLAWRRGEGPAGS